MATDDGHGSPLRLMSIDCVPHQDLRRLGRAEASAELYHWGGQLAQLLVVCSLERRNQLEVHVCGGTTQILRELRRLVSAVVSVPAAAGAAAGAGAAAAAAPPPASFLALAPQLKLLAFNCSHETVATETRRLAAGEPLDHLP